MDRTPIDRTVVIHGWDDAAAALAGAAGAVTLLSAPGAGGYAGAGWFAALAAQGRAAFPDVPQRWVLDCGDAPGHVFAALRAGVMAIVFTGPAELRERLAAVAAECGADVLAAVPA
jgi:hypothetical protein